MKKDNHSKAKKSEKCVKKAADRQVKSLKARVAPAYDIKSVRKQIQDGGIPTRIALAWMHDGKLKFSPFDKGEYKEPPPIRAPHVECVLEFKGGVWQVCMEHEVRHALLNPPGTPVGMGFNLIPFEGSVFDTTLNFILADIEPQQVARLQALHKHLQEKFDQTLDQIFRTIPTFTRIWEDAHRKGLRVRVTTGKARSKKHIIKHEQLHGIPEGRNSETVADASAIEVLEICLKIESALKDMASRKGMEPNPDHVTIDPVKAVQFGIHLGSLIGRVESILAHHCFASINSQVGRSSQKRSAFWKMILERFKGDDAKAIFGQLAGMLDPDNPKELMRINRKGLRRHNGKYLKERSFQSKLRALRASTVK